MKFLDHPNIGKYIFFSLQGMKFRERWVTGKSSQCLCKYMHLVCTTNQTYFSDYCLPFFPCRICQYLLYCGFVSVYVVAKN